MQKNQQQQIDHCKIAIVGNVDSGKSTLVGVLTKGILDDGRGSARIRIFNYPHQVESGRTSSIALEIMGFDQKGHQIIPERFNPNKNKYWKQIAQKSSKVITICDLCGHQKYLKTTINGLVGLVPDYALIVIGGNMGISKMTKQHLGITLFLKIPFFIVITKIDIAPANVLEEHMAQLTKLLKSSIINKMQIVVNQKVSSQQLAKYAQLMIANKICPIFMVSSVTNYGVQTLIYFISKLPNRDKLNKTIGSSNSLSQFDINQSFIVSGVGLVVSGIVKSGTIRIGQNLYLGPDKMKNFINVIIKSIHVNRIGKEHALPGQFACLAIKPTKTNQKLSRNQFRKGMILVESKQIPETIWQFQAEVHILHHATTIKIGYQAVLHCGVIRQAVHLMKIYSEEVLRNDDKGLVLLRFKYFPEYLKEGLTILLRQGRTKILGVITRVFKNVQKEQVIVNLKQQRIKQRDEMIKKKQKNVKVWKSKQVEQNKQ